MLLHDNCIFCLVKLKAVVEFHCIVKCTNSILYFKCIFVMAESDKTLMKDDNFSNSNRKSSAPSIVPPSSGTLLNDKSTVPNAAVSEPSTLKRKQTSFQITSVTVKGSRLSTDGGEDSADDLDESHTEDASSDILDCSRTTDVDNDQLSEDNSNTTNNDDTSKPAPSIPVESKVHLPTNKKIAQNNALIFPSESSQIDKLLPSETSQHVKPPTLPDQWQHRFRVVKIVSSVPFKRGRWLCMDFMDPPAPIVEAKPESIDPSISSGILPGESIPADRVAHVYEIPPGDAYPGTLSMVIRPDERLQPMYGIFLPISNGQYPLITGMNSKAIATPVHTEAKTHESAQSVASTQGIQHNVSANQSTPATQAAQHQKMVSSIQAVSTQGAQHQQNISNTQSAVSTQGFQHQQNMSSTQSVVSTPGIQHQQNVSVIQPVVSTQGSQHNVSSTQSAISTQGVQQTTSNIQCAVSTQGSQHIVPNTQSSVSIQGVQQMVHNTLSVLSTQNIQPVVSSTQSVSQGMQQNVSGTQPAVSSQVQQNVPGIQPAVSNQGVQHQQNVSAIQTAVSTQGIQHHQNASVIQSAVSSQAVQHPQNISGIQPTIPVQGIQLQQISSTSVTSIDHNKPSVSQATPGVQNSGTQKQEKASQSITVQSNTPPQSQTSIKVASNVAGQQQASESAASHVIPTPAPQVQAQQAQESQPTMQPPMQVLSSSHSQAVSISPTTQIAVETATQPCMVSSATKVSDTSQIMINQDPVVQPQIQQVSTAPISAAGTQASVAVVAPDTSSVSNSKPQEIAVPSQVIPNHVETKELGTPPSTTVHVSQDVSQDATLSKSDINGEESESVPSGTSTVAIDNKIEQAMDLVKSHLMFAVREEVDVLKEKITELMDRISQLEYENGFLRANASQQTLEQLNQSQLLQQQQQQNQSSAVSVNSVPQLSQQSLQPQQLNIQDQQPTS